MIVLYQFAWVDNPATQHPGSPERLCVLANTFAFKAKEDALTHVAVTCSREGQDAFSWAIDELQELRTHVAVQPHRENDQPEPPPMSFPGQPPV